MPRPVSIHDDAILAAAGEVFLSCGYQASTAAIARRAGVSEGSIFKRFRTKTELFLAAMNVRSRGPEQQDRLLAAVGRAAIRPTLETYGRHLLRHLQTVMPRILMVNSSGLRFAKNYLPRHTLPPPLQHVAILTRYLQAENACGRLRLEAPKAQADAFVGALSHHVFCETVCNRRQTSHNAYVRMLVDNILRAGAAPRQGRKSVSP